MKWNSAFFRVGLTLALLAGVSCTTNDTGTLTDAPVVQPLEQPSQSLGLINGLGGVVGGVGNLVGGVGNVVGGVVGGLLEVTGLLKCSEQPYDVSYETIGPKGGEIKVGKHVLDIPRGALTKNVRIKAEQLRGSTNSVRFSPEGLKFEKPAELTLEYKNCENADAPKAIVYTSEKLEILEVLRSLDLLKKRVITAPIDHFSRYAVAF